jgi:hypothetical protein
LDIAARVGAHARLANLSYVPPRGKVAEKERYTRQPRD